jgi:Ca-activated chloride channel family protein
MKRFFLLLLAGLLNVSLPAFAAGLIVVEDFRLPPPVPPIGRPIPLPPPRHYPFAPLELASHRAHTRIKDQIATTSIDEEFYNPNPRRLEGTFLFPVPKGAHLDKFTMEINGKPVQAELLAADKARAIYEDIVRRSLDPALLEYAGRDLFKVRIFPIEPHERKRIKLAYTELLKSDGGLVNYTLPLNTTKYSARPIKNVSVKVELETRRQLKTVYSPSHQVDVRREAKTATVGFEASDVRPDMDFQLLFSQEAGDIGVNLLTHRTSGDEGYFLLFATPSADSGGKRVLPKDVVFVLDTSGSMAGNKLEQAKKALLFCVENLNDQDRFEVVRFSTEAEPLFDKLVEVTADHRKRAASFIKDLKPIGSTAIEEGLRKGMALRPSQTQRPFMVIFLTDGRPTIGITNEDQILASVKKHSGGNTRVFCFGIGTDVNTHLLDRITEETRAFSQYVLPEEDIETKVSNFFSRVKEPVLADVKITFPDGIRATKLYPAPLPDLFKGDQLVLAGRYQGHGSGKIVIEGSVGEERKRFTYEVKFPETAGDHEFIPRLWATRRVGYLLDEIRLHGENAELRDEVANLARKYGIVTPYTAYLIVEDERRRGVTANQRSLSELEKDQVALRRSGQVYEEFKREKGGDVGVAGAQGTLYFKQANASGEALARNQASAERAYALAPTPITSASPTPAARSGGGFGGGGIVAGKPVAALHAPDGQKRMADYTQQNRFVGGKNFFQNGSQWMDADVQNQQQARRMRVQFNSTDYFKLLASKPASQSFAALGRNVEFFLDGTIYEIFE